jgi:hypothetical protein
MSDDKHFGKYLFLKWLSGQDVNKNLITYMQQLRLADMIEIFDEICPTTYLTKIFLPKLHASNDKTQLLPIRGWFVRKSNTPGRLVFAFMNNGSITNFQLHEKEDGKIYDHTNAFFDNSFYNALERYRNMSNIVLNLLVTTKSPKNILENLAGKIIFMLWVKSNGRIGIDDTLKSIEFQSIVNIFQYLYPDYKLDYSDHEFVTEIDRNLAAYDGQWLFWGDNSQAYFEYVKSNKFNRDIIQRDSSGHVLIQRNIFVTPTQKDVCSFLFSELNGVNIKLNSIAAPPNQTNFDNCLNNFRMLLKMKGLEGQKLAAPATSLAQQVMKSAITVRPQAGGDYLRYLKYKSKYLKFNKN